MLSHGSSRVASDDAAPYRRKAHLVRHISLRHSHCSQAAWMIRLIGPDSFTGLRSFALPLWTPSGELWGNHIPAPMPVQGIEVGRLFASVPILRICVTSRTINSTSLADWTATTPAEVHVAFARPRLDQQSLPPSFLADLLGFQPAPKRLVVITARGDDQEKSFRTRVAPATYARDLCSLLRPLMMDSDASGGRHSSADGPTVSSRTQLPSLIEIVIQVPNRMSRLQQEGVRQSATEFCTPPDDTLSAHIAQALHQLHLERQKPQAGRQSIPLRLESADCGRLLAYYDRLQ